MVFAWTFCDREFDASKGLKNHLSQCALKRTQVTENDTTYNDDVMDEKGYSGAKGQTDTTFILMPEELCTTLVTSVQRNTKPAMSWSEGWRDCEN